MTSRRKAAWAYARGCSPSLSCRHFSGLRDDVSMIFHPSSSNNSHLVTDWMRSWRKMSESLNVASYGNVLGDRLIRGVDPWFLSLATPLHGENEKKWVNRKEKRQLGQPTQSLKATSASFPVELRTIVPRDVAPFAHNTCIHAKSDIPPACRRKSSTYQQYIYLRSSGKLATHGWRSCGCGCRLYNIPLSPELGGD